MLPPLTGTRRRINTATTVFSCHVLNCLNPCRYQKPRSASGWWGHVRFSDGASARFLIQEAEAEVRQKCVENTIWEWDCWWSLYYCILRRLDIILWLGHYPICGIENSKKSYVRKNQCEGRIEERWEARNVPVEKLRARNKAVSMGQGAGGLVDVSLCTDRAVYTHSPTYPEYTAI